ncbi:MAG TPA: hypothetical protein VG519_13165 [Pseudochrobactrum sp.]|nr:hypothetical protein [Pseudochrobactrum sp.]
MTARQRLQTCAQNLRSVIRETTPSDYPVVSLTEALATGTRSDTLYAAANYHVRQNNWPIAKRLRAVAASVVRKVEKDGLL